MRFTAAATAAALATGVVASYQPDSYDTSVEEVYSSSEKVYEPTTEHVEYPQYTSEYHAPATTEHVQYITEEVTEYTTYCPAPTTITHDDVTYTVTEPTTLTITNCAPCTVTYPVVTSVVTSCPGSTCSQTDYNTPAPPASTQSVPPPASTNVPVYPPQNGTSTYAPAPSSPAPYNPPTSAVPVPTGAANKAAVSGAGLAAVFGFVAYLL